MPSPKELKRLTGLRDARSTDGIFARGKNVYRAATGAPNTGRKVSYRASDPGAPISAKQKLALQTAAARRVAAFASSMRPMTPSKALSMKKELKARNAVTPQSMSIKRKVPTPARKFVVTPQSMSARGKVPAPARKLLTR